MVVGAGTIGGWAGYFAASAGAGRVVVIERGRAGDGASSRAAGIVRAQGGTPTAVRLGRWSIDFYRRQSELIGTDSGFRELGYLLLAVTGADERAARERLRMQHALGLDAQWLTPDEAVVRNPTLNPGAFSGATYFAGDGCIDPPRNVRAFCLAMQRAGVELREGTAFTGLRVEPSGDGPRVAAVETAAGTIETGRVILTGGPFLRQVGELAGMRIPVGGVRHQVAVTEPHPAFEVDHQAMAFDLGAGLYWRLEEGGLLFGMSNPGERPGIARTIDWAYLETIQRRLARLVPLTNGLGLRKAWAATIDFTPDHFPILGPGLARDGTVVHGTTVAAAGGHGMMWGPAVAKAAVDLALDGMTEIVDVRDLGLDRFDAAGNSRLNPDPVALPFPPVVEGRASAIPTPLKGVMAQP